MMPTQSDPQPGLRIRPLTAADRELLAAFPRRVSAASATARFHGAVKELTGKALDRLLDLESGRSEAVIAVDEAGIAAVGRYVRDPVTPSVADIAIVVADDVQRRGVARRVMTDLASRARNAAIDTFRADVLASNTAARQLVTRLWPVTAEQHRGDEIVYLLDLHERSATDDSGGRSRPGRLGLSE